MGSGNSRSLVIVLLLVVAAAVLAYALLCTPSEIPIEEHLDYTLSPYMFEMGDVPPGEMVTAIVALDAEIVDDRARAAGQAPKLYIGRQFYLLAGDEGLLKPEDLDALGLPISDERPFLVVDLYLEPWFREDGDSDPVEGYAKLSSVERVWDIEPSDIVAELVPDFTERKARFEEDISLARLALEPEKYNAGAVAVICSFADDGILVVLDDTAYYEGPLEWYVRPHHLITAAYHVTPEGEATDVTLALPLVAARDSGKLRIVILADRGAVLAGEEIVFMLALENTDSKNYTVEAGPPLFDLNLYDKSGLLGSWSSGKGFPEYIEKVALGPGEVIRQTLTWDLIPLDPHGFPIQLSDGNYEVKTVWVPSGLESREIEIRVNSTRPALSLNWSKTGGIAGVNEQLRIGLEGDALVRNLADFQKSSLTLTPVEHWGLHSSLEEAGFWDLDESQYRARGGVADFFSYELVVDLDGAERRVAWVDDWAAEQTLPDALTRVQVILGDLATRVWTEGYPLFD